MARPRKKYTQDDLFGEVEYECTRCYNTEMGERDSLPEDWYRQNGYILCPECRWPDAG